jgi:plastocyanin
MTRQWRTALIGGVAAVACLPAIPAAGAAPRQAPRPPVRMLVYAQEWSLWPSRSAIPAGKVTVQLWNRGMDAHDLRIRRVNWTGAMIGRTEAVAVTASGQLHQSTWRLGAGTYELYCSMPGHAARGMHARIRVN